MKKIVISIKRFSILMFLFVLLSCYSYYAPSTQQPSNMIISEERINVDWSNDVTVSIRGDVMDIIQSNLRRYRYYHITFRTHNDSANARWNNQVIFRTYQNPSYIEVSLVFNYFLIDYRFSNSQLISGGVNYRESPYFTGNSIRVFTRHFNELLDRVSFAMRGMTFSNEQRYLYDMLWIEALRFRD